MNSYYDHSTLKYFVREKHNKNMIFKIVSEKHLIKC